MLNGAPPRWRPVVAALGPTARVSRLGPAGCTALLAAVPAIVVVLRGDDASSIPLVIAGLVGGATLGWATEDPTAELFTSMPVASPVRTALRLLLVSVVAALGVGLGVLVLALGPGLPSGQIDRLPEAATAAAVAAAVGLLAGRRGATGVGPVGVTAGLMAPLLVAALAFRWPRLLPSFMAGGIHARWWVLAALGLVVVTRVGRDPGRD